MRMEKTKVKTTKKRYSVPSKIIELLYTDDSFFNEVSKSKKAASGSRFPRSDEWISEDGFNMSFALAGYSAEDVSIFSGRDTIIVESMGIDSIEYKMPQFETASTSDEGIEHLMKERKPRIHVGAISRGIARRKFRVSFSIDSDFDVDNAKATMENGLLHILIPSRDLCGKLCEVKIERGR